MRFKRVWHPYWAWEEMAHGMWSDPVDRQSQLELAIEFTGDHIGYGSAMLRVVREWPISCENALTDAMLNRRAWVGHAACALMHRLPERIVREAWGHLRDEQQLLANKAAERAIVEWELSYAQSLGLSQDLGGSLLL